MLVGLVHDKKAGLKALPDSFFRRYLNFLEILEHDTLVQRVVSYGNTLVLYPVQLYIILLRYKSTGK